MDEEFERSIRDHLRNRRRLQAFELLLGRYQDKVFRLCCSILADTTAAEDTAQDVFLRVWKALPGFEGRSAVSTWIYAIARNACLSRLELENARRTVPLEQATDLGAAEDRHAGELEVRSMLARLPRLQRQVLILFYFEDKSYEEVAAMLGLPLGTVKTHLHRAKKKLGLMREVSHGVS